jgi:hypothetical protein
MREANGLAESKDPYTLMISSFAARHSPDTLLSRFLNSAAPPYAFPAFAAPLQS